jgi:hypothetical protein
MMSHSRSFGNASDYTGISGEVVSAKPTLAQHLRYCAAFFMAFLQSKSKN